MKLLSYLLIATLLTLNLAAVGAEHPNIVAFLTYDIGHSDNLLCSQRCAVGLSSIASAPETTVLLRGDSPSECGVHGNGNIYAPDVHRVGQSWRMWYGGQGKDGHDRIHLADSKDGRTWEKRGVVLEDKGANHVNDPSVVRVGDEWWMYYTRAAKDVVDEIALATSRDGVAWEKKGVVLRPGTPGTWDALLVGRPSVLREDGVFKMWYDGRADLPPDSPATGVPKSDQSQRHVGYAESADGVHWERKSPDPVFHDGAGAVHVARISSHYLMVYESNHGTKVAVSADGLRWKARGFLVQNSGTAIDAYGQVTPFLWSDATGREARLFYGAARERSWSCNIICSQPIPAGRLAALKP